MKQHYNDVEKELHAVTCVPLGVKLSTSDMCGYFCSTLEQSNCDLISIFEG